MAIDTENNVVCFYEQVPGEAAMPELTNAQWEGVLAKRREFGRPLETAEVLEAV